MSALEQPGPAVTVIRDGGVPVVAGLPATGTVDGVRRRVAGRAARPTMSVLIRVRGAMPDLRPAERRVAEAVLAEPAAISESSITAVARRCQTSETTVLRFCRALGLTGYPELRIALARAAQWEESDRDGGPVTGTITSADSLAEVVEKVTYADARAIEDTGAALDLAQLEAAVTAVASARRVDIYAVGASALVGEDLQLKLHRVGLVAAVWPQYHQALTAAALLGPGDVAVALSHTGTTLDTVEPLQVAREHGATTIAVTNFARSPVSEHADLVLTTAARETTFRSGALASRIAQLAVVDCLFTGVAQRSFDSVVPALDHSFVAMDPRRRTRPVRSAVRLD